MGMVNIDGKMARYMWDNGVITKCMVMVALDIRIIAFIKVREMYLLGLLYK